MLFPVTFFSSESYRTTIRSTPNLLAYYRLGEVAGTTGNNSVIDDSGNGRHGTPTGVTFGKIGALTKDSDAAAGFNTSYVTITDATLINLPTTGSYSVEFWARSPEATRFQNAAVAWGGTDDLLFYFRDASGGTNNLRVFWRNMGGTVLRADGVIPNSNWHHFVATYDGDRVRLYINGVLVTPTLGGGSITGTPGPFNSLRLGMWAEDAVQNLIGHMDEVAFYNRALTTAEITDHYNAGIFSPSQLPNLKLWLDSSVGLYDATTGGNLVTVNGNPVARWEDQSGNGFHATQATSANQMTLIKSYVNGLPALVGNGSHHFDLSALGMFRNVPSSTIIAVWRNGGSGEKQIFAASTGSAAGSLRVGLGRGRTAAVLYSAGRRLDADALAELNAGADDGSWQIHTSTFDWANSDLFQWRNSSLTASSATFQTDGNTSDTDSVGIRVAGRPGTTLNSIIGHIAELIVTVPKLSDTDREATESYLATKYDLKGYSETVQAEPNVLYYWPMNETTSATTLAPLVGTTPITLGTGTAKPTMGVTGKVDGTAMQTDGVNDFASVPLDLTAYNKIVVEFWLWWDAFANDDDLAMEFTTNISTNPGSFFIDPNLPTGTMGAYLNGNVGMYRFGCNRPSAGAWHHYVAIFDMSVSINEAKLYIDGVLPTATVNSGSNNTGNFTNSTLYLMSRAGSGLFGAGRMQHLAIYSNLTTDRITAHYNKGIAS